MAKQSTPKSPKRRRIKFTFYANGAASVCLVGDFNNWDEKRHVLDSTDTGTWSKTIFLAPGIYEYKFKVDNQWVNDPENDKLKPNCFGTKNNLILIP